MRKQSPETQLRHAKRRIKELERDVMALKRRHNWGAMMSNICFNLGQKPVGFPLDEHTIKGMNTCRKGWDEAR